MTKMVMIDLHSATMVAAKSFFYDGFLYEATTHTLKGGGIVFVPTVNASVRGLKKAFTLHDAKRQIDDWIISQIQSRWQANPDS